MSMSTQHLTTEELSAYLDGEIVSAEMPAILAHLAACSVCAEELDALTTIKNTFAALGEVDVPRSFALTREMVASPSPLSSPASPTPIRSTRIVLAEKVVRIVAIAAAVVFIALGGAQLGGLFGEENTTSNDVALVGETDSSTNASQNQESAAALSRGEVRETGESAAAESSAIEAELARVDTTAQVQDSGLTAIELTTVSIGIVALAAIACWILLRYRAGTAS